MYKVLIAEDELIIRKGIIYCVDWAKLECSLPMEAGNGQEAVEMILSQQPDIVLLDLNMPLLTGIEVLQQTIGTVHYTPIIITGYPEFEYAKQAMFHGVQRYLLKPLVPEELEEAIVYACRQQARQHLISKELEDQTDTTKVLGSLPDQREKSQIVRQVMDFVEAHYPEKITIGRMAREFHYSETLLIRRFKGETGVRFSEYLTHYRLLKATELISGSEMSLVQVAEACGFSEYRYFRSVFKNRFGYTPKQYQEKLRLLQR